MCGYKHQFSRNLIFVIYSAMVLLVIIVVCKVWIYCDSKKFCRTTRRQR